MGHTSGYWKMDHRIAQFSQEVLSHVAARNRLQVPSQPDPSLVIFAFHLGRAWETSFSCSSFVQAVGRQPSSTFDLFSSCDESTWATEAKQGP